MDFNQVLELIRAVSDSELTAFQYEEGNQRILMQAGNVAWNGMQPIGVMSGSAVQTSGMMPGGIVQQAGIGPASGAAGSNAQNNAQAGGSASNGSGAASQSAPQETAKNDENVINSPGAPQGGNLLKAPLVGTFYTAPSEDAEPYVRVGDHVKKGQVLAIVEAMKLMNEIESEFDGVVTEILAENGKGVEYGQPLFRIS